MVRHNKQVVRIAVVLALPALLLAACGGGGGGEGSSAPPAPETPAQAEPVTLTFYYAGGSYGEQRFMELYGSYIMKKFPHMTLNYYQSGSGSGTEALSMADAVATGLPIDVLYTSLGNVGNSLLEFELQLDHSELIRSSNYDLGALIPQAVNAIKGVGGGALYGLPVAIGSNNLYYNRNLFDKFGVPYPGDVTWDELHELTRKMARTEGGVHYRGLVLNWSYMATFNPIGAGLVDPATNKTLFTKDERWQRHVNNLVRFYRVPGNEVTMESGKWASKFGEFSKGTAAMLLTAQNLSPEWVGADIAKFPVSPDKPGVGSTLVPNFFGVTGISRHKEEAFKAIAYLTSKEYQVLQARTGTGSLPVITDPEAQTVYGQDVPWIQERKINVAGWFPKQFAEAYPVTPFDGRAASAFAAEMEKLAAGVTPDVNTALRQAAEAADKAIEAQLAAKK